MPLKLTVSVGDLIEVGDDVVIEVLQIGRRVQLSFDAPRSVNIGTIFKDPSLQDKNLRKAQNMSPEQQNRSIQNGNR